MTLSGPDPKDDKKRQEYDALLPKSDQILKVCDAMGLDPDSCVSDKSLKKSKILRESKLADFHISPFNLSADYLKLVNWQIERFNDLQLEADANQGEIGFTDLFYLQISQCRPLSCLVTSHQAATSTLLSDESKSTLLKSVLGAGDIELSRQYVSDSPEESDIINEIYNLLAWIGHDAAYLDHVSRSVEIDDKDQDTILKIFTANIHHLHFFCDTNLHLENDNSRFNSIVEVALMNMGNIYPDLAGKAIDAWSNPRDTFMLEIEIQSRYSLDDSYQSQSGKEVALDAETYTNSFIKSMQLQEVFTPITELSTWRNPFGELTQALESNKKISLSITDGFPFNVRPAKLSNAFSNLFSNLEQKPLIVLSEERIVKDLLTVHTEPLNAIKEMLQGLIASKHNANEFTPKAISHFKSTVSDDSTSREMAGNLIGNLEFFRTLVGAENVLILTESEYKKLKDDNQKLPIVDLDFSGFGHNYNADFNARISVSSPNANIKSLDRDWDECIGLVELNMLFIEYILEELAEKHGTDQNGFVGYYRHAGLAKIANEAGFKDKTQFVHDVANQEKLHIQLVSNDDQEEDAPDFDDSFADDEVDSEVNSDADNLVKS